MKSTEKTENRKAMPKFLLWLLASGVFGAVVGGTAGFLGGTSAPETLVDAVYRGLTVVAPWSIWGVTAVLGSIGLLQYCRAKRLFILWDGEDEETMDRAEEQLSWSLFCTSLLMILDFFLAAAGTYTMDSDPAATMLKIGLFLLSFVLSMAVIVVLQQRVVDLTKRMNPEKQGSVYDLKFQKKWIASCDENEQRQIGQAAMKAFTAVNTVCVVCWLLLMLLRDFFDLGLLPVFLVTLIWGVAQMTYCLEAIRLGRHK